MTPSSVLNTTAKKIEFLDFNIIPHTYLKKKYPTSNRFAYVIVDFVQSMLFAVETRKV